ncbi:MAG TPA: hypothetical protein VLX29_08640 [Nitrospirota bacterium]|nr:hypothetical protein [Nitrospirota bacterium]
MQKRMLLIVLTMLFISSNPLSSLVAATGQQTSTQDELQQKKQYEHTMEERLGKLGRQLDELKAKAAVKTEEARKEMKKYLVEAEKKQKKASRELEKLRKASVAGWKKISAKMDKAADEFEDAYEKAKSRM